MIGLLSKERIIAPPDYNRWRVPLASVAIHLCIGSVYTWSIYNLPLTRAYGVVTSTADDWTLSQVVWGFYSRNRLSRIVSRIRGKMAGKSRST